MIGRDLVPQTEDSRDASFVRVESSVFSYAQLPEHNFLSSILNLWIVTLAKSKEYLNLNFKISSANYSVFLF
jgi:hypothetical protein